MPVSGHPLNEAEAKVVAQLKAMMASNPEPNLAVADQMVENLEAANLAKMETHLLDTILVHPQNRMS